MPHRLAMAALEALSQHETRALKDGGNERRFQRFAVRGDAELHSIGTARLEQRPILIQIRDIGWGGVGFLCQEPLALGSMWRANFLHGGYIAGTQSLVVCHHKPLGGSLFLVGGQFIVEAGLLRLLGIEPVILCEGAGKSSDDYAEFVAPSEVA